MNRSRNKDGTWRKKRSDAGVPRGKRSKILELPDNPDPKLLRISVNWHYWHDINQLMEKYDWDLDEVFYHIFEQWTRLERWLEHDEELQAIWESIIDEERLRRRDYEDALHDVYDMEFEG